MSDELTNRERIFVSYNILAHLLSTEGVKPPLLDEETLRGLAAASCAAAAELERGMRQAGTERDSLPFVRCTSCGSRDVRRQADMAQNQETGVWEVTDEYDQFTCESCGGACDVEEEDGPRSEQGEASVFAEGDCLLCVKEDHDAVVPFRRGDVVEVEGVTKEGSLNLRGFYGDYDPLWFVKVGRVDPALRDSVMQS